MEPEDYKMQQAKSKWNKTEYAPELKVFIFFKLIFTDDLKKNCKSNLKTGENPDGDFVGENTVD